MREILFRGRRIDTGEWVYGQLWVNRTATRETTYIVLDDGEMEYVEPSTIGQYTGLNDKIDVKTFEGDVLVFDGDRFVIFWDEERGGFRIDYWQSDEQYDLSDFWPESEIIGNIHDNPEFMEETE